MYNCNNKNFNLFYVFHLFPFDFQVDEDWMDLFTNANERNLLINIENTESAVKCVLREYNPNEVQQQNSNPSSQSSTRNDQPRGVRLIENAPPPPRLVDPRKGSRVSCIKVLSIKVTYIMFN